MQNGASFLGNVTSILQSQQAQVAGLLQGPTSTPTPQPALPLPNVGRRLQQTQVSLFLSHQALYWDPAELGVREDLRDVLPVRALSVDKAAGTCEDVALEAAPALGRPDTYVTIRKPT